MKTYKEFILEARDKKDKTNKDPIDSANNIPKEKGEELMHALATNKPNAAANLLANFRKYNPKHPKTIWASGPIRPTKETTKIFRGQ